ncbi:MAG: V-type ATP synthase subunit E [Thermococcus sp.]|uniref:A-type ATP synthase subunit E n=1 Tax=Thermococcus guaymasensis DSM 11113 TaxID=1432656 RepID=A0A0X1KJY0_9EURY|nr:V-type ATP synthase subunit E [Thermococcus guaymasensis]AJC71542.1 V-type ATP synthase subunit E [Thermococcus guaymasensis DSM 11113]MCD6523945.1 V-type ATP synthase subunit E [Thermococcus sp.]
MDGAELIIQEINRAAEQKIQYILSEAREEAEKLKEEARKRAQAQAEWILRKAKTRAAIEKQRIIANAKLEVRKKKLAVQEELIGEVLSAMKEKLAALPEDEYFEVLVGLAKEAVGELGIEKIIVRSNEKTLRLIESRINEFSERVGADVSAGEPIECIGGVLVESPDGTIKVDNTFDGRIERLESELRAAIAKALFG